jgi:5'-deoxynucleotidase YfbR-like HD superfamily hydrolase
MPSDAASGSVFLSHSSLDRHIVEEEIIPVLEKGGVTVWYSPAEIRTSEQWERSIRSGLESSEWFVIVISRNSAKSEWVKHELNWAVQNRWSPGRIIPIALDDSKVDVFHLALDRLQWVHFRRDPQAKTKLVQLFAGGGVSLEDGYYKRTQARVEKRISELSAVNIRIPFQPPINVIRSLKALPRQGKLIRFKEHNLPLPPRSVLDHVYSLAHTADVLLPHIDHKLAASDVRRLANCITFHDLCEVLIDDYPAYTDTRRLFDYERTADDLAQLENAANKLIRPWLGPKLLLDFDDSMSVLDDSNLALSRFLVLIDKIDPIIAIWRYLFQFRSKLDVSAFLTATEDFFSNSHVRRVCELSAIDKERMCALIEFLQDPEHARRYYTEQRLPGTISGLDKRFPLKMLIEGRRLTFISTPHVKTGQRRRRRKS